MRVGLSPSVRSILQNWPEESKLFLAICPNNAIINEISITKEFFPMFNVLTAAGGAGMGSSVIMLVAMLAIFYFLLIRPENKRKKEAETMRSSVKTGDKITTIGGIVGTVVNVKDEKIVIETGADQVRIELAKWAISSNESAAEAAQAAAKKAQEEKAKAKAAKKAEK